MRYPVTLQYKILLKDVCYIFMFISCSQIFGLMGAFGGVIVQEVVIWDLSEDLGSIMAAACVIVGLVSSILVSVTLLKYKNQFMIFIVFQVLSAIGICISYLGLTLKNIPVVIVGTLIYSIFTFPSFPIMIELIGKRVGKPFELVATGNVYFMTQVITAVVLAIVGSLLNDKEKSKSTYSFILISGLLLLNGLFGYIASITSRWPFNSHELIQKTVNDEKMNE